jgi:hypothetical protein
MITGMTEQGREMGDTNRWAGFSDEELSELRDGTYERSESSLLTPATRERISRLCAELDQEVRQRESRKATYQGPGLYATGERRLEVLGTVGAPKIMGTLCQVVMHDQNDPSGLLLMEYLHGFNKVDPQGRRAYEYLGPLEEDISATAKVKLIDAGPNWALLETGKGQRHRLYGGDVLKVPKVIS